jgi:phosphoenolpyruvate carboxykinase (GTP)
MYYVNWFRRDENGGFLWPGFGENSRVLKWIFERCDGKGHAKDTPIGRIPEVADLDMRGLEIKRSHMDQLLRVDIEGWLTEVPLIKEHFARFGSHLPEGLKLEVKGLEERLHRLRKNEPEQRSYVL